MDLIFHDELISSQGLHPLLSNPPYNLTLSVAELTTPKERPHVTDNEEETIIPRPHNAFIIFRNDFAAKVKDSPEKKISIRLISQMASNQWRQESESVKLFFKLLADMYQHNHRILYPDYKYSPKYNSRRARRRRSKPKSEELKGKKGRIITWYIHDNTDKDLRTGKTDRYAHLNVFNLDDVKTVTLEENANPCKQKSYPPATFINYTATPTTPLVLHSTTTTSSQPITLPPTNFHHYHKNTYLDYTNNDVISDSASSYYDDSALSPLSFIPVEPMETLSPHSSPPSADECLFWAESSNNNDRGAPSSPFGFDDLFDNQTIFEI